MNDIDAKEGRTLFIASSFDLQEFTGIRGNFRNNIVNTQGRTLLEVAITHGSCDVISILLENKLTIISEEAVKAAAENGYSGKNVMMLLL